MKICLVRHGETDWNRAGILQGREDIPLNARGMEQADRVAEYLKSSAWRWQRVLTSPLSRAFDTAQRIARALGGASVEVDRAWIERDYGKASGLTGEQRRARYPGGDYEGLEPLSALQKRAGEAIFECARRHAGEHIVIVSHGGLLNSVLAVLSGGEIGSGKTRLKNAGLTMLDNAEGVIAIDFYNRTADELLGG